MTPAIVVGSGPNGLAAALTLASVGVDVAVLEAADTLGGGTRSSELTLPGMIHDECSAAHPLAVDTPFSRRFDLASHGLTWRWPEVQYAHPLDDGTGGAAFRSVDEPARALGKDGGRWGSVFGPLAERFDDITADFLRPMLHVPDHPVKLTLFGMYSALPAAVLARRWSTPVGRALFAGVAALNAIFPRWSPDGKRITFSSNGDNFSVRSANVYVMRSDGSQLTQVTHRSHGSHAFTPEWSPDGTRLVYSTAGPSQAGTNLEVLNLATRVATVIYRGAPGTANHDPAWSRR
jgi:NAD(P)-binding Rossmann-like domain/WD40-like Beta Propeller Repeat